MNSAKLSGMIETNLGNSLNIHEHSKLLPKIADSVYVEPAAVVIGDVEIGHGQ